MLISFVTVWVKALFVFASHSLCRLIKSHKLTGHSHTPTLSHTHILQVSVSLGNMAQPMDDVIRKRLAGDCFHMRSLHCLPAATKTTSKSSLFQQFVSTYDPSSFGLSLSLPPSPPPCCLPTPFLSLFPSPLHLFLTPCFPSSMIPSPSCLSLTALPVVMPLFFVMELRVQENRDVKCWRKTRWRRKKIVSQKLLLQDLGSFKKKTKKKRDVCSCHFLKCWN